MAERKKISELGELSEFYGGESIPLVSSGANYRATMGSMKEYFKDSTLVVFDEIVDSEITPNSGTSEKEDGVTLTIVYLSKRKIFAQKRVKEGFNDTYFANFPRKDDYMVDDHVRPDRVFFNIQDKEIYVAYGDTLGSVFNVVRINAMTEDEFSNLTNPIEGAFYATYEED